MSGRSLGWQTARRLYESEGSTAARVLRQVWSAVDASDGGSLVDQLRQPLIDRIAAAAANAASKGEAHALCNRLVRESRAASFAAVLATRAAVAAAGESNPSVRFVSELMGAATDYLVSRDASGYVGGDKFPNVAALTAFKGEVAEAARNVAASVSRAEPEASASRVVELALARLKEGRL